MKLDPNRTYHFLHEREPFGRIPAGFGVAEVATLFLTASRCPIGCAMCDLHHNTLPETTPQGAIERQIHAALDQMPPANWIKLYNSGNFFDAGSIPPQDYQSIADCCQPFDRVIIENHPRFGASKHERFRDLIDARLEIAVGLETVQPRWLSRMRKQMTRDEFDQYANGLRHLGIDLRVFLIVGVPGITAHEAARWARLSVRHAAAAGARHISLIPARFGHGWNGQGDTLPDIGLARLSDLFADARSDVAAPACVSVDLWGFEFDQLSDADKDRMTKLRRAILSQDTAEL